MRKLLLASVCVMILGAWLDGGTHLTPPCKLTIVLVDAESGKALPGLVQIRDEGGKHIAPAELLGRGLGLALGSPIHDWSVLARATEVEVPATKLTIKAFAGLETEFAEISLDLTGKESHAVKIPLVRFYDAHQQGLRSANTHLHLRRVSLKQADRYLVEVSEADGLDIVFVSYLERAKDDLEYTSNKYTAKDFQRLTNERVAFDHGEEHRHNFTASGEGYGHVMLLNIPELIQPVSIGPGISAKGTDGIPLARGITEAREKGGKVIWCHNSWGMEDVPNWIAGRLHANNIFDGGTHGSYKHSFYRYLNAGLRVPFSTGTDWFMYDFSRVYVPAKRRLTPDEWLDQLSAGRSTITNGPLLEFRVADKQIGDTVELSEPGIVHVRSLGRGRMDFERIELIRNGQVIQSAKSAPRDGHFEAKLDVEITIDEPCWLALRTPPPSSNRDPEFTKKTPLNEYGRELFAHTSAIFVDLSGRRVFQSAAAESLMEETRRSRSLIEKKGFFANPQEKQLVLTVYDEALDWFRKRLDRAK